MGDERLLTVEGAARLLQLGRTLTYTLVQRGDLASVKIGRSRRVPVQAIDAYIERLTADQAPADAGR